MESSALAIDEIQDVSKVVTHLLVAKGWTCCLVGSAAGHEHGLTRIPNDVDVLVMTDEKPEVLKNYLASEDPLFYWEKPATNPQAAYSVLRYSLSPLGNETPRKSCRVDVFIPGMIHLPQIPKDKIVYSSTNVPVMPFFPTLLHKIQAWKAHLASTKAWVFTKQRNDVRDIEDLLETAMRRDDHLGNQNWLEQWFLDEAIEGVQGYVSQHPENAQRWIQLGFS